MKNSIFLLSIIVLIFSSCGIFKTHHKNKLIDYKENSLKNERLKLNGYYFAELDREYGENPPPFIAKYIKKTGINKIKYISVFFIYKDGYAINLGGIDGLSHFYCAAKENYENTYESAHKTIALMLEAQNATDKRTKRICGFRPNDIGNKGLVKINNDTIKIQFYGIAKQNLKIDSYNSAYLYELNGIINSDASIVIKSETKYRTNEILAKNLLFTFRKTDKKPNIENYFKKNKSRFK
mgnify:CR=1 FL=1